MTKLGDLRSIARQGFGAAFGPGGELAAHRAYHRALRGIQRFGPPEDAATIALLRRLAARADTILDVGANVGRYTHLLLGAAASSSVIHAFEPHPRARALLTANVGADSRVRVHALALGAEDGEASLAVPRDARGNPVTALAHLGAPGAGEAEIGVQVRRLDTLVAEGAVTLAGCVLAKVDVEGYEADVFRGAASLLASGASIYFESQQSHLDRVGRPSPLPLLRDAGYEVIARSGEGWARIGALDERHTNYLAVRAGVLGSGSLSHARVIEDLDRASA